MLNRIRNYRPFVERATEWGLYGCMQESLEGDGIEYVCLKVGLVIVGVERRHDIEARG